MVMGTSKKTIRHAMPYELIMFLKKHKLLTLYINSVYRHLYLRNTNCARSHYIFTLMKYVGTSIVIAIDIARDETEKAIWEKLYSEGILVKGKTLKENEKYIKRWNEINS